jgi:hypothetical protein
MGVQLQQDTRDEAHTRLTDLMVLDRACCRLPTLFDLR